MRDFAEWVGLVEKMAAARREARDHAPRVSNDHLEAGMFLGMLRAFDAYMREHFPTQEPAVAADEPTKPSPAGPSVVTDTSPPADHEPEGEPEQPDAESEPAARRTRRRGARAPSDGGEGDQQE